MDNRFENQSQQSFDNPGLGNAQQEAFAGFNDFQNIRSSMNNTDTSSSLPDLKIDDAQTPKKGDQGPGNSPPNDEPKGPNDGPGDQKDQPKEDQPNEPVQGDSGPDDRPGREFDSKEPKVPDYNRDSTNPPASGQDKCPDITEPKADGKPAPGEASGSDKSANGVAQGAKKLVSQGVEHLAQGLAKMPKGVGGFPGLIAGEVIKAHHEYNKMTPEQRDTAWAKQREELRLDEPGRLRRQAAGR